MSNRTNQARTRKRSGGPGGLNLVCEATNTPNFRPTIADTARWDRLAKWSRAHPVMAEDGVYLDSKQIYTKIMAERTVTDSDDVDFMETIDDQISAHAEVGRRFHGSKAQAQRLSDIYRRAEAT